MVPLAAVVLVDRRGWLLLQERDEHAPIDPECWGLAGGHVEEGEDFESAAYRELAEETGITLAPGTLQLWTETRGTGDREGHLMRVYVAGTDLHDSDVVCGEGRQIVFVDPSTLADLPLGQLPGRVLPDLVASDVYRELVPR